MPTDFSIAQLKKLVRPLDPAHIKMRVRNGKCLDYIEGWFAISEANAIFGYGGWNREMVQLEKVFETREGRDTACGYFARVRITVRSMRAEVIREGTGFGEARCTERADAHELALKAAETDATKRALATFGRRFGLTLYDKDANGAGQVVVLNRQRSSMTAFDYALLDEDGAILARTLSPEAFCSGLRQLIETAASEAALMRIVEANRSMMERVRLEQPNLRSQKGRHFVDILGGLAKRRVQSGRMGNRIDRDDG